MLTRARDELQSSKCNHSTRNHILRRMVLVYNRFEAIIDEKTATNCSMGSASGQYNCMWVLIIMLHIMMILKEWTDALWNSDMWTAEVCPGERRAKEDPIKAPERWSRTRERLWAPTRKLDVSCLLFDGPLSRCGLGPSGNFFASFVSNVSFISLGANDNSVHVEVLFDSYYIFRVIDFLLIRNVYL